MSTENKVGLYIHVPFCEKNARIVISIQSALAKKLQGFILMLL